MNSSDKIKNAILTQYKSGREFSNIVGIPNSTLVSALDKENGIGGMAVEKVVKICEALNLDIKDVYKRQKLYHASREPRGFKSSKIALNLVSPSKYIS